MSLHVRIFIIIIIIITLISHDCLGCMYLKRMWEGRYRRTARIRSLIAGLISVGLANILLPAGEWMPQRDRRPTTAAAAAASSSIILLVNLVTVTPPECDGTGLDLFSHRHHWRRPSSFQATAYVDTLS